MTKSFRSKALSPKPAVAIITTLIAMVTLLQDNAFFKPTVAAEPLSIQGDFAQRLQEPHTGLVDGQSLRLAIRLVADNPTNPKLHLNTWIDRKVNPDAPVSPGTLGPTRYVSLRTIAKEAGCVCYPIDNCILIGRPEWVAELSRAYYLESSSSQNPSQNKLRSGSKRSATLNLNWPDLTTPNEALRLAKSHSAQATETDSNLPHDLWPAADLRDISPRLAQHLVLGQFLGDLDPSRNNDPFARSYRFPNMGSIRGQVTRLDPNATLKINGGSLRLLGSPNAHQWLCDTALAAPNQNAAPAVPAGGNALEELKSNKRKFTMTADVKPAGLLIKALTAQIGIQCEFDANANQQLETLVSFTAKDQTLWQLVRLITGKASLKIEAAGPKLRVSSAE